MNPPQSSLLPELTHFGGQLTQAGLNAAHRAAAGLQILTAAHPVPSAQNDAPESFETALMLHQITGGR